MSGPKVLVIGGTGMLGKPVLAALAKGDFEVSALVRKPDAKLPAGVKACVGDVFDAPSLEAAMAGKDVVYLNLALQPEQRESDRLAEREGLATIIAAAKKTGVKRLASIVAMVNDQQGRDGFDWWALRVKVAAERTLLECGLPVTLFRCATFMENFDGGMRQGNAISLAGKALHPSWYLAGADYGHMVAKALSLPTQGNQVYVAQGPEPLLAEAAAQRFIAAYPGTKLKLQKAPLALLSLFGLFSQRFSYLARMLGALNQYQEPFAAQATWDALGKPPTTIEAYAKSLTPR